MMLNEITLFEDLPFSFSLRELKGEGELEYSYSVVNIN